MTTLERRATRRSRIRRTTWSAAATIFSLAWLGLLTQLASGHDPVLGRRAAQVAKVAPAATAPPVAPTVDPSTGQYVDPSTGLPVDPSSAQPSDPSTAAPTGSSAGQTSSAPAPVVTQQS